MSRRALKPVILGLLLLAGVTGAGQVLADDVPVTIDGTLTYAVADQPGEGGSSTVWYDLDEMVGGVPTGITYNLGQSEHVSVIDPGTTIRVVGILRDNDLLIPDSVTKLSGGTPVGCQTGTHNMLVLICNYQNQSVPAQCTQANIYNTVFGATGSSVRDFYLEESFGTAILQGDVTVPLTINYSPTNSCSYTRVARLCDSAATQAGYNLSNYPYRMYVAPAVADTSCTGGIGLAPTSFPARGWGFGACDAFGITHEYGHNLGFGEANTWGQVYGDHGDVQGHDHLVPTENEPAAYILSLRHHSGAYKAPSCFVPAGRVLGDPQAGTYELGLLEQNLGPAQVIRSSIAGGAYAEAFYFDYRKAIGFDINLLLGATEHVDRTNIHRYYTGKYSAGFLSPSYLVGWLGTGVDRFFRDYDAHITLEQLSQGETSASIRVSGEPGDDITPPGPVTDLHWNTHRTFRWFYNSPEEHRGFYVYRNNRLVEITPYTHFGDTGATSGRAYTYYVRAYDDKGLLGPPSDALTVTIPVE